MGLLDVLFGKKNSEKVARQSQPQIREVKPQINRGMVRAIYDTINPDNIEKIRHGFIALDLETTGLSAERDKIIEVGAVRFENGEVSESYGSLIKIGIHVPEEASRVNHITDEMLNSKGKHPQTVYGELVEFLGNALNDDIVVVAHNANFDIGFIKNALEEYGYSGTIRYIDTLKLSRAHVKGLINYKQDTVAEYFEIINSEKHRAVTDAETCGRILTNIIDIVETKQENDRNKPEISLLNEEEKETAAIILNILKTAHADMPRFLFYKNSAKIIDIVYIYTMLKFKVSKKGGYIIVPRSKINKEIKLEIKECTKNELSDVNVRVCYDNPFEIEKVADTILEIYDEFINYGSTYDRFNQYEEEFFANATMEELKDIPQLIQNAKQRIIDKENEITAAEEEKNRKQEAKEQAKRIKEEQEEQKRLAKASIEAEKERIKRELLETAEKYDEETIKRIVELSEAQNKRAVIKMDDENNIYKVYYSLTEASQDAGIAPKTIRDVCNGKNKHGGGFCWKYADEYV